MTAFFERRQRSLEIRRKKSPAEYAATLFTHAHDLYALSITIQALDVVLAYRNNPHTLSLKQLSSALLGSRKETGKITGKAQIEHSRRGIQLTEGWENIIPGIIGDVFSNAELFSVLDTPTIEGYIALYPAIVATPFEQRGKLKTRIKRELTDLVDQVTSA